MSQWDPRVIVSLQENAWVDARTHIYAGLEQMFKPVNDILEGKSLKGVICYF